MSESLEPKWASRFFESIDPKWAATLLMGLIGLLATRWEAGQHIQAVEKSAEAKIDSSQIELRREIRSLKVRVTTLEKGRGQLRDHGSRASIAPRRGPASNFLHHLLHPFGG